MLYRVSHKIVSTYVDIKAMFSSAIASKDDDKVLEYSRLVLSLGLLYMEFVMESKDENSLVLAFYAAVFPVNQQEKLCD